MMQSNSNIISILDTLEVLDFTNKVHYLQYEENKLFEIDEKGNPLRLIGFFDKDDLLTAIGSMKYLYLYYPYVIIEVNKGSSEYIYSFYVENIIMKLVSIIWSELGDNKELKEVNDRLGKKIEDFINNLEGTNYKVSYVHTPGGYKFVCNNTSICSIIEMAVSRSRIERI